MQSEKEEVMIAASKNNLRKWKNNTLKVGNPTQYNWEQMTSTLLCQNQMLFET